MSASQEKKVRQQLREEGKDKRQIAQEEIERAQKRRHRTGVVTGIIAVVLIVALFIFSSNLPYTTISAVTIGDTGYSAAEYSFFYKLNYNNFVNQYGSYLSMMGLDTTKSLDSQQYTDDQTWAQYFQEAAQTSMKEMTALYDDAIKNGFTLSDEDKTSLDSTITSMQSGYADAGFASADKYLTSVYGKGCTVKLVSSLVEKYYIAQGYSKQKNDSLTYTDDQLKAYYTENKNTLDQYTYIASLVDGSVKIAAATDTADASASPAVSPSPSPATDAEKAAAMEKAKGIADAIVADVTTEDEFKQAVLAQTQAEATESTTQGSSLNEKYADWMKDASRKAGDTTVVATDTGYYAVYYISRDSADYKTVNVRHILIKAVAGTDGTYSDEAKATAKKKAEALLAEWSAGAATQDSFAELATANTEDTGSSATGGLYENVAKDKMIASFNDWIYAADRKAGDTGIVYAERAASSEGGSDGYSGYHVIYFVGEGKTNSDTLSEDALRTKDFTAWKDALLANYEIKTGITAALVK